MSDEKRDQAIEKIIDILEGLNVEDIAAILLSTYLQVVDQTMLCPVKMFIQSLEESRKL